MMKWTIGQKLAVGFVLLFFITGIIVIILVKEPLSVREDTRQLASLLEIRASLCSKLTEYLDWTIILSNYISSNKKLPKDFHPPESGFGNWYHSLDAVQDKSLKEYVKSLGNSRELIHKATRQIGALCFQEKFAAAQNIYLEMAKPSMNDVRNITLHIQTDILNPQIEMLEHRLEARQTRQITIIFSSFVVGMLWAVLVWITFLKKIVYPIKNLTDTVTDMTQRGDFSKAVVIKNQDEVGALAESFNAMTREVNLLVSEIEENALTLALDLSEQFEVLQKMDKGDFSQPAPENSTNELVAKLGELINKILNKLQSSVEEATASQQAALTMMADLKRAKEEVEVVNKDLEGFAYSVSHDLRAPLRAIDGFSRAVLTQYESQVDQKIRHFLERIRHGAQTMDHLINDLLTFSRVTRTEVKREAVATKKVVQEIIKKLKESETKRKIKFLVEDLPEIQGDASMVRVVFENLLDNAIKFTRPRKISVIEVGTVRSKGKDVFFVRDNGVGFDMTYSDKLFTVFQRLHRMEEFEGTGVGLATVKRIILKHGGDIWVDAHPNQGATFYFVWEGRKDEEGLRDSPYRR